MTQESLAERVKERLEALEITPIEGSRRAGFRKDYLFDLLAGRKHKVHPGAYTSLAKALECSEDYLRLRTNDPGSFQDSAIKRVASELGVQLPLMGVAEHNTLRPRQDGTGGEQAPIGPDARYLGSRQFVFQLRNIGAINAVKRIGEGPSQYLLCIGFDDYVAHRGALKAGDLVVCERGAGVPDFYETSVREVTIIDGRMELIARFSRNDRTTVALDSVCIIGGVVRFTQWF